jgi:hypothetical protein
LEVFSKVDYPTSGFTTLAARPTYLGEGAATQWMSVSVADHLMGKDQVSAVRDGGGDHSGHHHEDHRTSWWQADHSGRHGADHDSHGNLGPCGVCWAVWSDSPPHQHGPCRSSTIEVRHRAGDQVIQQHDSPCHVRRLVGMGVLHRLEQPIERDRSGETISTASRTSVGSIQAVDPRSGERQTTTSGLRPDAPARIPGVARTWSG